MPAPLPPSSEGGRASAWLSNGFESLVRRLEAQPRRAHTDFDVLVVGSGYGGAIAASALANDGEGGAAAVSVCVLERGKEYLPGAFPSRMADLAGHTRVSTPASPHPSGEREGLFDVRIGADVNALVANGLGGGSLINAGVMLRAPAQVLAAPFIEAAQLEPFYARASRLLGAEDNTIASRADGALPLKFRALARLNTRLYPAPGTFRPAPITVAMNDTFNSANVALSACTLCGDCATGCNFNAKDSLDTNLLVRARQQGAELFTGATVLRIAHEAASGARPERWCVHVVFTEAALRRKQKHPFKLYASKLILAAGTFGSTEILLRSRSQTLEFSATLGRKFSGNGDMISVAYRQQEEANAIASEESDPRTRAIGPTITGMIELPGMLIEELAIPAPLRRLFEEVVTTANTLHTLGQPDDSDHGGHQDDAQDPCAVDAAALRHSSVLAMMGDDGAAGALELVCPQDGESGDGAIRVRWPALREHPLFRLQTETLTGTAEAPRDNGTILPNPLWKLLPDEMEYLLTNKRGPLMTVHPLGGCAIGATIDDGVVTEYGEVFRGIAPAGGTHGVFDTLLVLDGAIIPRALGVNPALTIAAVALRAVERKRDDWGWGAPLNAGAPTRRPVFMQAGAQEPAIDTTVEFVERMSGAAWLATADGGRRECLVELTMPFEAAALAKLALPQHGLPVALRRTLHLQHHGALKIYDAADFRAWKLENDQTAKERPAPLLDAPLTGTLDFMQREASTARERVRRTIVPWLLNRGLRDLWQWAAQRWSEGSFFSAAKSEVTLIDDVRRRYRNAMALASRGGEVRLFEYALRIGAPSDATSVLAPALFSGQPIRGRKRFTYGRAANPWHQLTRLSLDVFPALDAGRGAPVLELDTAFLVQQNTALMRILSQKDQPSALGDVAGLGGYLLRVMLNIHMWSFRKPDTPAPRSAQRLPGAIPGLPMPQIREIDVDQLADGTPVRARLTRYLRADMPSTLAPVMMIHGYSASGTSFAHPQVAPNMASYLWHQGHDVWILDMRTSSGMPTARMPWTFEDAAHADIPAAVDYIVRVTERDQIDVVAHCMGGAMTGMAILGAPRPGERFAAEREALQTRIRHLVLSQVGPLVVFSQANIFRAYLMGYLRQVLPLAGFSFRVDGEPSLADELIDRALATMPYPDQEFRIENPVWPWQRTPFVGTRHRMDALYGRDFSLANLNAGVLDNIDDFFGPLSIETVSQAIHLARQKTICNRAGRNVYVSRANLQRWRNIATLSIHGEDNGLADIATLGRMRAVFADAGIALEVAPFKGFGHQDCLIGRDARVVFETVAAFLAGRGKYRPGRAPALAAPPPSETLLADVPWTGPVRTGFAAGAPVRSPVGATTSPLLPDALLVAFVPVVEQDGRFRAPGGIGASNHAIELYGAVRDNNGWMQSAPGVAPAGADGMLMLLIYDAGNIMASNSVAGTPMPFTDPLLAGQELLSQLRQRTPEAPLLLDAACALLAQSLDKVYQAIDTVLTQKDAGALRSGLLEFGPQDLPAAGHLPRAPHETACFAVASCQYPAGILDQLPAFDSYARLSALLDRAAPGTTPEFLLLMGDQIYADATAGLFDPTNLDDRYVRPYEKLFGNGAVKSVLRRLPAFMMLDDHEITDNWERDADGERVDRSLDAGRQSYFKYERTMLAPGDAHAWFSFVAGGLAFFMADTRSEREARAPSTVAQARIMGRRQWAELRLWLRRQQREPAGKPKFIVTASIVAPRRLRAAHGGDPAHCLRSDAWDGYPASLHALLAFIARRQIQNVVFLSGDEHISLDATISVTPPGMPALAIRSIHSSGLYSPFPFANSGGGELADDGDRFDFADPRDNAGRYRCAVRSSHCAGDGFAVITVGGAAAGWPLDCRFDRAV